ncbi:hypothetical protein GQ44DRAFT_702805 [Phaeosphaeriaceae sp. PMI808]|nr:hypothetical protein GQ44DRAFT_702805 [Phaeosphaeriaceae sp. PMI808]
MSQAAPPTVTRVLRSQTAAQTVTATVSTPAPPKTTKSVTKARRRRRADPWLPRRKVNPNPQPRPRAPPPTHFTCRICIEEQTVDQFPKWASPRRHRFMVSSDVPYGCIGHLARNPHRKHIDPVCKTCLGNAMSARIDQLGARQVGIGCLELGCENEWSWDFIMKYMPAGAALEKYNVEMFNVWKQDWSPKLTTCIAPGCEAMGLPDITAAGYPQVVCHTCSFRSCANCNVPWHKDVTCAEYHSKHMDDQMTDSEKETLKLMQTKDGKRCPNCQLVIEKDGGCNSMLCTGCNKYFDWVTAASAVPGAVKAIPVGEPWYNPHPARVCEMDAIELENSK